MTLNAHVPFLEHDAKYQLNSNGDFFYPDRHIKLENTNLELTQVAEQSL